MLMATLLHPHRGQVSEDPCALRSAFAAPPSPRVSFCSALRQMCCLIAKPQGYGLVVGCGDPFVVSCIHEKSRLMRGLPHGSRPHGSWPHWPTCNRCFASQPGISGWKHTPQDCVSPASRSCLWTKSVLREEGNRSPAGTRAVSSLPLPMPVKAPRAAQAATRSEL